MTPKNPPLLICTPNGIAVAPAVVDKRCARCGEVKSVLHYNREARKKDGMSAWCKACKSRDQSRRRAEILTHDPAWVERRKTYAKLARLVEKGAVQKPAACPRCGKTVAARHRRNLLRGGVGGGLSLQHRAPRWK